MDDTKVFKISLTGVSGVGKSSIIKELVGNHGFSLSVSTTTRQPRPGEEHGVHYNFIDTQTFEKMIENGDFVEHSSYAGQYYGTPVSQLYAHGQKHVVFDLDPSEASFDHPQMQTIVRFLLEHDDKEVIKTRLRQRFAQGDSNNSLQARLDQIDNRVFKKEDYTAVINVTNKTPNELAEEILRLLNQVAG